MKITKIETIQVPEYSFILWVRIHTDEGVVGLGETYIRSEPARTVIEEVFAHTSLLGKNPLQIEAIWRSLFDKTNVAGWTGNEIRAISALDIALWDVLGQYAGLPIYQLLGGKCRDKIKVYNTCGGDDHSDFMNNPEEYARKLLSEGITAMKIWPFDRLAAETGGHYISPSDLKQGLEPIKRVHQAVGEAMEIALEFHSYWDLPCALRIARAVEEFQPMWLEDMMQIDNLDAWQTLSQTIKLPLAVSERLYTRYQFLPLLQRGIPHIVNPDLESCGGVTEAHKIASMADTYRIPVAFHNYGGPILNVVSAHLAAHIPNLMILESGRNLIKLWTEDYLAYPIKIESGFMALPEGAGLGNRLSEKLLKRTDLIINAVDLNN